MNREAAKILLSAFLMTFVLVPLLTRFSKRLVSPVKAELEEHKDKEGTPQLGGLVMLPAFLLSSLFSINLNLAWVYMLFAAMFAVVGFIDDFSKIMKKSSDGLTSLIKLSLQLISSFLLSYVVRNRFGLYLDIPIYLYYPFCMIYIAAIVNSTNIVDGLDTLCIKSTIPSFVFLALAFESVGIYPLIMASILFSFLFYNSKKATIFMGDGGSHLVGAVLSTAALLSGRPFIVLISMTIILLDMLSSFIQIISIRVFHRKVFLIAPIHHSFQKKGMAEEKIADRFFSLSCLSSIVCALFV
ncbi:MAG: hypothetical protein K6G51_07880 [Sphaerochaetaceae bacterium]|nr:hypothetical protein [Sphaerochaetaceae bacterium]